jgi:hypothetical protein
MTVALSAPNDERISVRLLDFRRQSALEWMTAKRALSALVINQRLTRFLSVQAGNTE